MTVEKSGHAGLWQGVVNLAEKLRDAVLLKSNVTGLAGPQRRGSGIPVVDHSVTC